MGYRRADSNMGTIEDIYGHKRPKVAHIGLIYIKISMFPK